MSRPIYENTASKLNEEQVAAKVCAKWGCSAQKMPRKMQLDYAMHRDKKVEAFLEVKCRTNSIFDFPCYFISLSKVLESKRIAEATGLPCFLAVRSVDQRIHMIRLDNEPFTVEIAGRFDRNDPEDIEPCCFFEVGKFKELK
jgi:hypothetical protein